jgi:hypothetical protein
MDSVKIENFKRENPGFAFPRFTSLTPNDCAQLRSGIAGRLGLTAQSEPLELLKTLRARATYFTGVNASHGFDLRNLISKLGYTPDAEVLVNWYRFDQIDRIAVSDLDKHFDDIWYPGSDDIEVFDESVDWLVLVRHDGVVSTVDLCPA